MAVANNAYKAAFEEADLELNKIMKEVEQLRIRQTQMGKVVEALKSLMTETPAKIDMQKNQWAAR